MLDDAVRRVGQTRRFDETLQRLTSAQPRESSLRPPQLAGSAVLRNGVYASRPTVSSMCIVYLSVRVQIQIIITIRNKINNDTIQ